MANSTQSDDAPSLLSLPWRATKWAARSIMRAVGGLLSHWDGEGL
ncbi:MAG TPA: hypothetical protein QGF05_01765 [Dehalococcoidia bacterium]|nr:hypothetical protein [Dehalococcoidia bacterium]